MGQFSLWTTRISGRDHGTFRGMTFEDLLPTWPDQPLTDPTVTADVVDLMVGVGDRRRGVLAVLLCDPDGHYLAAVTINLPPNSLPTTSYSSGSATTLGAGPGRSSGAGSGTPRATTPGAGADVSAGAGRCAPEGPDSVPGPAELCGTAMDPVIPAVHTAPGTALVLALGRPGPARLPDLDNQWAQAATTICRAAGIRLLGFYVATKDTIYSPEITTTPAAAA